MIKDIKLLSTTLAKYLLYTNVFEETKDSENHNIFVQVHLLEVKKHDKYYKGFGDTPGKGSKNVLIGMSNR